MPTSAEARIQSCLGRMTGVCRITPASFALATMLPLNVAAPITIPSTPDNCPTARRSPRSRVNSTKEVRNAAMPPAPC